MRSDVLDRRASQPMTPLLFPGNKVRVCWMHGGLCTACEYSFLIEIERLPHGYHCETCRFTPLIPHEEEKDNHWINPSKEELDGNIT